MILHGGLGQELGDQRRAISRYSINIKAKQKLRVLLLRQAA
jgi:hypothetical protein